MAKAKKAPKAKNAKKKPAVRGDVEVTLRFHGRFLFARNNGSRTGLISAVAAQYDSRGAGRHETLMTIRHRDVVFKEDETWLTTFNPHFRVVSPELSSGDIELMVWDLAGLTVTYDAVGLSKLETVRNGDVYDLVELEGFKLRSAQLDTSVLRPDLRRTNAVVQLTKADGLSESPPQPVTMNLAGEDDIRAGRPDPFEHPPHHPVEKTPADLVKFTVKVPDPGGADKACLTLTCTTASGEVVGTIALKRGAVIGISNSCPQIEEPPKHDLEFSRYYDLLTVRRPSDVLIPIVADKRLMEGMRCYMVSTIGYTE